MLKKTHDDIVLGHEVDKQILREKYDRVQHGYDQGVLEGMRQAYVNVRATLATDMENADRGARAFLVQWLHPRLAQLGEEETRLLNEMKGKNDVVSQS